MKDNHRKRGLILPFKARCHNLTYSPNTWPANDAASELWKHKLPGKEEILGRTHPSLGMKYWLLFSFSLWQFRHLLPSMKPWILLSLFAQERMKTSLCWTASFLLNAVCIVLNYQAKAEWRSIDHGRVSIQWSLLWSKHVICEIIGWTSIGRKEEWIRVRSGIHRK